VPQRIDTTLDFRTDHTPGRDPDTYSPTLRDYHLLLWSKPLPSGAMFSLEASRAPYYFRHQSGLGKFRLSSDAVVPTFSRAREFKDIMAHIPQGETDEFNRLAYTIGGMMVFPANQIGGQMTINGARGCNGRIRDRFDLTVECIRRQYLGEPNPLSGVIARYWDFFGLFEDFAGYVDFFLLHDLVDQEKSTVRFFAPFEGFSTSPLPRPLTVYLGYRERAMNFIRARNRRIATLMNGSADNRSRCSQSNTCG
jgi:hypothetical protein